MAIKILSFDLDDTLWPCMVTINQAEKNLHQWFEEYYPEISSNYSITELWEKRTKLKDQNPQLSHHISAIRRLSLQELAIEHNFSSLKTQTFVNDAFKLYFLERNKVSLYDEVLNTISALKPHYTLCSISNGNASLPVTPTGLDKFIIHSWAAEEAGVEKPHPKIFNDILQHFSVKSESILHIGDDPITDIFGAKNVGMKTLWLNRENKSWPSHLPKADHMLTSLSDLPTLLNSMG